MAEVEDCRDIHRLGRESATVQLQDSWSNYCRDLVLRSWKGGIATLGGQLIPMRRGDASPRAALAALRSTYSGRLKKSQYWEPKWFDPNEALDAASRLALTNVGAIASGLGLSPSPLDELRAVRNYFAHKGPQSVQSLNPYVSSPTSDSVHAFITSPTQGGAVRFERWAAQLDIMARAAAN